LAAGRSLVIGFLGGRNAEKWLFQSHFSAFLLPKSLQAELALASEVIKNIMSKAQLTMNEGRKKETKKGVTLNSITPFYI